DVVVTATTEAALAAKQATSSIPIVTATTADPVVLGLESGAWLAQAETSRVYLRRAAIWLENDWSYSRSWSRGPLASQSCGTLTIVPLCSKRAASRARRRPWA